MIENKEIRSGQTPLGHGYSAQFDAASKDQWNESLVRFADANIYQTWSYDSIRCGEGNISHVFLYSAGRLLAGAQARIVRLPFLRLGAAYVRWGPFWRLYDRPVDLEIFRMAVRALRNEYVCRRRLVLRLFPLLFSDDPPACLDILRDEGYAALDEGIGGRTLVLDIAPPLEEIRKGLDQKWRNCLNRAERNDLEVAEGADDGLFAEFIGLYQDLLARKKFPVPNDINEFRMIQRDLSNEMKMRVFLCRSGGQSTAGAICASIGETGVYLFGATNKEGKKNNGSYLAQWRAIQWLKAQGCRFYNLNGINPVENPGTYHFKAGLAGKNGKDVCYLGRFDCHPHKITATAVRTAERVFPLLKKSRLFSRSHPDGSYKRRD